ncbi:MAG: alanine racemase [Lachnospiraceae bacterium]|nr:alanine racemase [Lachnospiraceae bacterium]
MFRYERAEAQVDLDAIRRNLNAIRQGLKKETLLCPVVKADAYGHGAEMVAKAVEDLSDYFAVATIDEAILLREQGIQKPILLMGFTSKDRFEELFRYRVYPNIYKWEDAIALSSAAGKLGETIPIHISVDTGMNRLGFPLNGEAKDQITRIVGLPGLVPEGIFSHFVSADSADKTLANLQIDRFGRFAEELAARGVTFRLKHMAASAGTMDCRLAEFDMVRTGIITYGVLPSDEVDRERFSLEPALSLKSTVIYLKTVPKGETISYGATYTTSRDERIATVPVGYGDGYFRSLSNRGYVLIRGRKAPICGRICMDQFMVDVTDIPGVKEGDEVTLIGRDGETRIYAEELAALAGTIPYENLCDLGKRIPRVYLRAGEMAAAKDYFHERN